MKLENPFGDKIDTFVDAGEVKLNQCAFASNELNDVRLRMCARQQQKGGGGDAPGPNPPDPDIEKGVQYRLNQTGNIYYCTTTPTLDAATKKLFDSVTVLFAAMTKALADKGKSMFDYEAWTTLLSKTGYFVEVQKYEKYLEIKSGSVSIDTQVVQGLLPGLKSGSSLEIAKGVLSSLNGEYKGGKANESAKLGHLLFICEELFGAPSVTVRLFYASKETHEKIVSTPCFKCATTSIEQLQQANTFLFVSPDTIAEFAKTFGDHPESYVNLVKKLGDLIGGSGQK